MSDADLSVTFPSPRRYLAGFDPKRVPHVFTDVLIIGAGISGIRAALEVDPSQRVTMVTKDVIEMSNSAWAQGGIAGAIDPEDDTDNHAADTIRVGCGLCNEKVVQKVVDAAPELIEELVDLGTDFDRSGADLALTREGGHSHRRVVHALGDATGREIMRAMIERGLSLPNVEVWQQAFSLDLLTHEGRCRGAMIWSQSHGRTFVWAKQTILATGGAGQLYRETTNPSVATADGHALSFRAGAQLRDMEMVQFHPTVLYIAGSSRSLISEAVRGEGAYLRDSTGERFMVDLHERAELAPRDVVSRAIIERIQSTRHPCVYLDLTHLPTELVTERFPNIGEACRKFGLDLTTDRIPVRPGAHYMLGGLTIDDEGRTTLPGLWAAGEATSSGLHGANRLASNSLLEGLYFGRAAGRGASQVAAHIPDQYTVMPIEPDVLPHQPEEALDLSDLRNSLQSLMGRHAGIQRDAGGLSEAAEQAAFWDRFVSRRELRDAAGWELQNMLLTSQLVIASAKAREESRGVHFRSDHPETEAELAQHTTIDLSASKGDS